MEKYTFQHLNFDVYRDLCARVSVAWSSPPSAPRSQPRPLRRRLTPWPGLRSTWWVTWCEAWSWGLWCQGTLMAATLLAKGYLFGALLHGSLTRKSHYGRYGGHGGYGYGRYGAHPVIVRSLKLYNNSTNDNIFSVLHLGGRLIRDQQRDN